MKPLEPFDPDDAYSSDFAPENEAEKHLTMGRNWLSMGQTERAIESFRAALTLDSENPLAHAQMALALTSARRLDAARNEAQLALGLLPGLGFLHFVAGVVEWHADQFKVARAHLETAIELDPDDADSHAMLAAVFISLEKYVEAEGQAREALFLEPEEAQSHLFLGLALMEQNRNEEARPHLERAIELDPQDESIHHGAAIFYLRVGEVSKARDHVRESLRLDPENERAKGTFVQILGARNWFYGAFWKWSLALSRLPQWGRIAVIFGLWAGMQVARAVGRAHPDLQPLVGALSFVYLCFCLYTWVAPGIFNWHLRRSNQI